MLLLGGRKFSSKGNLLKSKENTLRQRECCGMKFCEDYLQVSDGLRIFAAEWCIMWHSHDRLTKMKNRLQSLDVLRGLTLFMLVFFGPVVSQLLSTIGADWCGPVLFQLEHEPWEGFRVWDLLMPQFLFMAGASMPFSLQKYIGQKGQGRAWRRIARRFVLLFILGMMVQGNLLGLDPKRIYLYSNTLQAIACGYVIAAVILLNCKKMRWQIVWTAALLMVYWIGMVLGGDYSQDGNFCEIVDRAVLGRFRDGVYWDADGVWHFAEWYRYTWIWSSLTFGATVMTGCLAGEWIRRSQKPRTALLMVLTGVGMLLGAKLWSLGMPIIKHIWTSSMALYAAGWSMVLLGILFYVIDCRGWDRGWTWLKVYGMNSITAYFLGETVNFRSIVNSLSYGLQQYMGDYYEVWLTFGNFALVYLILYLMYKTKVFVRV